MAILMNSYKKVFSALSGIALVVAGVFGYLAWYTPQNAEAAFPGDYTKYQEIQLNPNQITADLTNFPVYVDMSDLDVAGTDVWDTVRSDCGDIRITQDDGTTQVPVEVVNCNTSTKTGELHFLAPVASSSATSTYRIWYNGTDAAVASTTTYGSQAVWPGYAAVWHFSETGGGVIDSSGNIASSSVTGTPTYNAGGGMGSVVDLDAGDYFSLPGTGVGVIGQSNYTITSYGNTTAAATNAHNLYSSVASGGFSNGFMYYQPGRSDNGRMQARHTDGVDSLQVAGTTDITNASYTHTGMVRNGTTIDVFVSGISENAGTNGALGTATPGTEIIGEFSGLTQGFDGTVDELRIRLSAEADNWIEVEYNNINSPSTFYTIGTEVGGGGGGGQKTIQQSVFSL